MISGTSSKPYFVVSGYRDSSQALFVWKPGKSRKQSPVFSGAAGKAVEVVQDAQVFCGGSSAAKAHS